mmetsp:Transcript_78032/g.252581  ORF Transcript_78032/g.252581 Transcript_78032/m.252581 type:complete len:264 (+) Transcript_78032:712-1503(+)
MTSTPRAFSTWAAAGQQLSWCPWRTTSFSGTSQASTKPRPAFTAPKTPGSESQEHSTQCCTTVTSVPSLRNLMAFLPSSCLASLRTSTLPWPAASRMDTLPPGTARPTTCFSFTKPFGTFSLGHWNCTHSSSIVTSNLSGNLAAMFLCFMSAVGAFLTRTRAASLELCTSTFALTSGSLSSTGPFSKVLAFSASCPRSLRGTWSLIRTKPWAAGSRAAPLRSSGILTPKSLASGAQRSATFFRNPSGTFAKYSQSSLPFRLFW